MSTTTVGRTWSVPVSDGGLVHVEEHLPGTALDRSLPTLVCAHGWTLTRESWQPVIDEVHRHRAVRIITYDQRGHGRSQMGRGVRPSIRRLGADLAEVIAATTDDAPIVLAGHSMGGMTVMAYAGQHHDDLRARVHGVVLVSTAASIEGRVPIPFERFAMGAAARMPGVPPWVLVPTRVQGQMLFGPGADPKDVRAAVRQVQRTKMPVIGQYFTALSDHNELESLAHFVDVPTEILVGTLDRLTPVAWSHRLHEEITGSSLIVLPGLGHMLTYEATNEVADAVIRRLDRARL